MPNRETPVILPGEKQLLSGDNWTLTYFPEGEHKISRPSALRGLSLPRLSATVPGDVYPTLSEHGVLPADLFLDENMREAEKFEHYEWWYETAFSARKPEGGRLFLRFEAVDCFAEYYLNDERIGASDDMFIPVEFDVTDAVKPGENTLAVRLRSPVVAENEIPNELFEIAGDWRSDTGFLHARRAPHTYGWDIMPRAVGAGIWRDAYLYVKPDVRFEQSYLVTRWTRPESTVVEYYYDVALTPELYGKELRVSVEATCGDASFHGERKITARGGEIWIDVADPKLWWPRGYGDANLYDVTATLTADGIPVATDRFRFGLRTVELDRKDGTATQRGRFRFLVNGTEIMVKGTNWVPMEVFHSKDAARYGAALALVEDCGCNMLRCWGGNVYEDHAFFDWCDAHGVMVWQDFAMACGVYPRSEAFLAALRKEAESVVRRLRQHPSLALWSGDNECDCAHREKADPNVQNRATREVLPDVVMRNDVLRPYLPSSPYISPEVYASGDLSRMPEDHLWGIRDYYKTNFYGKSRAAFVSETGYHGCPSPASLSKFLSPAALADYPNGAWCYHSTDHENRKDRVLLMETHLRQLFGFVPEDRADYAELSQISQAEALKFFIERIRIARPETGGILFWNLLDGWPQISDAIVDYYFEKKLAYDVVKRLMAPVCLFFGEIESAHRRLVASNDTRETKALRYRVTDAESGRVLAEGTATLPENGNATLASLPATYSEQTMLLVEWEADGERGFNHYVTGGVPYDAEKFRRWYRILGEKTKEYGDAK